MKREFDIADYAFFILLIVLSLAFYKVISYFVVDIILAAILAHLFSGLYKFLNEKWHFPTSLASFTSIFFALFFIIIPLVIISILLSRELTLLYLTVKAHVPALHQLLSINKWQHYLERYSFLQSYLPALDNLELKSRLPTLFSKVTSVSFHVIRQIVLNISLVVFHVFITIILMFFLLIDADKFITHILKVSPIKEHDAKELFAEITKIVDATLLGTVIIGAIEGIFGGILFIIFHLPHPVFWGVMMSMLSLLPLIGINSVFLPTGVILIASGKTMPGLAIIIIGYCGTFITQHYLKPYLVGRKGGLHPAIVLLSTIGGLASLGVVGFILGPVIASLFVAIWNQFARHYRHATIV